MIGQSGLKQRKSIIGRPKAFLVYTDEVSQVFKRLCEEFGLTEDVTVVLRSEDVDIIGDSQGIVFIMKKQDKSFFNVEKVIYRNQCMKIGLIFALGKLMPTMKFTPSVLRLEHCNLNVQHIELLSSFAQNNTSLQYVSLNGNPIQEQNHYLLLTDTCLMVLSLKLCGINAEGMEKIANVLYTNVNHPLIYINLASNCLYDDGMKYVAKFLRINRTIKSLNLADNKIRYAGLQNLLEPLTKFKLLQGEIAIRRRIKFAYHKKSLLENTINNDSSNFKKKIKADSFFGNIEHHPFVHDTEQEEDTLYCKGNDTLTRLNLSYNRLKKEDLKLIMEILNYQRSNYCSDEGIFILLEGNDFKNCEEELNEINKLSSKQNQKKRISKI